MMTAEGRRPKGQSLASECGAVLVEFTLIMIPFFLLTYGVVEMARIVWTKEVLDDVAIRVARCMAVAAPPCGEGGVYDSVATIAHIKALASARSIPLKNDGIEITKVGDCGGMSDFSRVQLSVDLDAGIAWLVKSFTDDIPLQMTACFPNQ